MKWTLSVSTLITEELRIAKFLETNRAQLPRFDEVLLICQIQNVPLPDRASFGLPENCRVIESRTKGISASRNVGIDKFRTELIWFMDDDTELASNLDEIKNALQGSPAEVNTLRIQDINSEALFRQYPQEKKLSALELLRVSSIEITCRRTLFDRTGIRFPEWIGVGTALPSGEENLFLHDALKRGAMIRHLPFVGCRHPLLRAEMAAIWSRPNRMRSMGIVARQFGAIGLLLCLRWWVRGVGVGVPSARLLELWKGYFNGGPQTPEGWTTLSTSRHL